MKNQSLSRSKILSVSQILARVPKQREQKKNNKKSFKPIIPPKSFLILLKEKPEKVIYNSRMIDYKHCGLLQKYIGLGGKILPRRVTGLTTKQQTKLTKAVKRARILALLPFVSRDI